MDDAGGVDLKNGKSGFGVLGFYHLEAFILKHFGNDKTDQFFILGHKDDNLVRHISSSQVHDEDTNRLQSGGLPLRHLCEISLMLREELRVHRA
jgi:hypothetical protein